MELENKSRILFILLKIEFPDKASFKQQGKFQCNILEKPKMLGSDPNRDLLVDGFVSL